ncbi:MAG: hypothetical protein Q7J58_18090 [Hydrogenophaga sp.]|uniref:hypothetical protein n=1 Tax=Hydrogenophaga sp. TaxID=1904254 RepID=UPI00272585B3|nr:hypothetical protein [Hydrogenophaga sp.]MDO9571265.1 hypothetical protein [Hydrogenophaga sp.]
MLQVQPVPPVLQVRLVKQDLREPQVQRELQALQATPEQLALLVQMELQVPMGPWVPQVLQAPRELPVPQA